MKQVVLQLDFKGEKCRKKITKTVSHHSGVESISLDTANKKLTVTGDIDPVSLVSKLRKLCVNVDILSVGPPKKEEEKKKEEKKPDDDNKPIHPCNCEAHIYSCPYPGPYYCVEEYPNSCVIC